MKLIKIGFIFVLYFSFYVEPKAAEVLVLGNESMPFCGLVDGKPAGIVVDLLEQVTKHGGPKFNYKLGLPWKRVQFMAAQSGDMPTAIVPLTRSNNRESNYFWIQELLTHEVYIHTYDRPSPPRTIEDARDLPVSVILGSVIIPTLKSIGFNRLTERRDALKMAIMLANNRITAIAESRIVHRYYWTKAGKSLTDIQLGPKIGGLYTIYLAGNKTFPENIAKQIRQAFSRALLSGSIDEVRGRW